MTNNFEFLNGMVPPIGVGTGFIDPNGEAYRKFRLDKLKDMLNIKPDPVKISYNAPSFENILKKADASPLKNIAPAMSATGGKLKSMFGKLSSVAKANPLATAGIGALGAANLAGLVNDDYTLGQLIGTAAGGTLGGSLALASVVSPIAGMTMGLGGGALGSIFDTIMARRNKQKQEQNLQMLNGGAQL